MVNEYARAVLAKGRQSMSVFEFHLQPVLCRLGDQLPTEMGNQTLEKMANCLGQHQTPDLHAIL